MPNPANQPTSRPPGRESVVTRAVLHARTGSSPDRRSETEVEESLSSKKKPRVGDGPDPAAMDEDNEISISSFGQAINRAPSEGLFSLAQPKQPEGAKQDARTVADNASAPPPALNAQLGRPHAGVLTDDLGSDPGNAASHLQRPRPDTNGNTEPKSDTPDCSTLAYLDVNPSTLPKTTGRTALSYYKRV